MATDVVVTLNTNFHQVCVTAASPQLKQISNTLENKAESYCPVGETGNLRRSVYSKVDGSSGNIELGATMEYAAAVEYGHEMRNGKRVPENSFLRRALYEELR